MKSLNRVLVNLSAIEHNYLLQKSQLPEGVQLMPVIKANAYGHGMVGVAKALHDQGAAHFAVARPEEGLLLRQKGCMDEILVLGATDPKSAGEAVEWGLSQTVFDAATVTLLEKEALRLQKPAWIHIKLDTGMNRIGCKTPDEARAVAKALGEAPHVRACGIYTHFADADNPVEGKLNDYTLQQLRRFQELSACFDPAIPRHVSNSAMALLSPENSFQMARQGISLYGYPPVETPLPFRPAMTWRTEVTYVKTLQPGECVSYGCEYTASRETRVATIAVGYGDGYHRCMTGKAQVLIRGCRAPIIGRICMDQAMVDVTDIPGVTPGDEVVLMGTQGHETISANELAGWAGTIGYEMLLAPSERIPRIQFHEENANENGG